MPHKAGRKGNPEYVQWNVRISKTSIREIKHFLVDDPLERNQDEMAEDSMLLLARTKAQSVPLLGHIAAGRPIPAEESIEGYLAEDPDLLRGDGFALRVHGDSMLAPGGAGICDGDVVIVRQQARAEHGEIVVALLEDGTATVKRWCPLNGRVVLKADNPAYESYTVESPVCLGKVVALRRRLA